MTTRRLALSALAATLALGCSEMSAPPRPAASGPALRSVAGLMWSLNVPISWPNGVGSNTTWFVWVTTGTGARDTYEVDWRTGTIYGTVPTGGEPRDVSFDWNWGSPSLLFGDLNNSVVKRTTAGVFVGSFPLPFRGAGIASDGDTIWVGDFDSNQMLSTTDFGATYNVYPSAVRLEDLTYAKYTTGTMWALTPFPGDNKVYEMTTTGHLIRSCETPYDGGPFGLGGIDIIGDTLIIVQPQDPANPAVGTTLHVLNINLLVCTAPNTAIVSLELQDELRGWGGGQIRVGVVANSIVNTSTIDVRSLTFGPTGTEARASHVRPRRFGGDSRMDIEATFRADQSGFDCTDTRAYLRGFTMTGQPFLGSAPVTVRCKP